jgi:hypothetical protein
LTGANSILVNGGTLTNIPILNIGDTVNLVPGDVVILMRMKSSWAIMGRVIVPGGSALAANVVATQTFSAGAISADPLSGSNLVIATTPTFTIPAWANRIDFLVTANASVLNDSATAEVLYCSVAVDYSDAVQQASGDIRTGIASTAAAGATATSDIAALGQNYADFRTGSIAGLTFTANVRLRDNGTAIAAGNAAARVSCIAVYTKV